MLAALYALIPKLACLLTATSCRLSAGRAGSASGHLTESVIQVFLRECRGLIMATAFVDEDFPDLNYEADLCGNIEQTLKALQGYGELIQNGRCEGKQAPHRRVE